MKNNKGFWDRWAKRYDTTMKKDRAAYDRIAGKIKQGLNRNMIVLELACGTGILSEWLVGSVKMLEATDFSEEMIREAKKTILCAPALLGAGRDQATLCRRIL